MFKTIINAVKRRRQKRNLKKVMASPESRLALMKAGYSKFSKDLTVRERELMKKEIKTLERALKNWNKAKQA